MSAALLVLLVLLPVLVISVVATIWWVLVLVEAVKVPDPAWAAAGQNKLLYVLLMVFLGVLGSLIYVLVARPALKAVGGI